MASLLILELHTGIRFQGLQQAGTKGCKKWKGFYDYQLAIAKIDVATITVRNITQTDPVHAPDDEHVAPVSLAPSPVIKHVTPALAVPHVAPAPGIEYVSSAHVIEYMAPAPAVTVSVPSQQLPLACSTTTDTTHDNFDITDLVHPQFSFAAVEASSSLAVGSLPIKSIWNRSLQER